MCQVEYFLSSSTVCGPSHCVHFNMWPTMKKSVGTHALGRCATLKIFDCGSFSASPNPAIDLWLQSHHISSSAAEVCAQHRWDNLPEQSAKWSKSSFSWPESYGKSELTVNSNNPNNSDCGAFSRNLRFLGAGSSGALTRASEGFIGTVLTTRRGKTLCNMTLITQASSLEATSTKPLHCDQTRHINPVTCFGSGPK